MCLSIAFLILYVELFIYVHTKCWCLPTHWEAPSGTLGNNLVSAIRSLNSADTQLKSLLFSCYIGILKCVYNKVVFISRLRRSPLYNTLNCSLCLELFRTVSPNAWILGQGMQGIKYSYSHFRIIKSFSFSPNFQEGCKETHSMCAWENCAYFQVFQRKFHLIIY